VRHLACSHASQNLGPAAILLGPRAVGDESTPCNAITNGSHPEVLVHGATDMPGAGGVNTAPDLAVSRTSTGSCAHPDNGGTRGQHRCGPRPCRYPSSDLRRDASVASSTSACVVESAESCVSYRMITRHTCLRIYKKDIWINSAPKRLAAALRAHKSLLRIKRGLKFKQGCPVRKLRHIVPAVGRPHRELPGNRPVTSVKGQRLLRR
jgi:hypothetical protein